MPINVEKTTSPLNIIPNDIIQKKTKAIVAFLQHLYADKNTFDEEYVFEKLFDYIKEQDISYENAMNWEERSAT